MSIQTLTLAQREIEDKGIFNDRIIASIRKLEKSGCRVESINKTDDEEDNTAIISFIRNDNE